MRSGGIWATATEEDLAKIVVNTLMESKEGYRKSPVLSSEDLSLRKQQHEEETEPAPELKGKQRTLSTSEEIKVQRESIAKEMEKHQKKKQQSQTSKTKKKSRKKSIGDMHLIFLLTYSPRFCPPLKVVKVFPFDLFPLL